jgi:hypothetical protein
MIPYNNTGHPGDAYDRQVLMNKLEEYYNTSDHEKIRLLLKRDLKERRRIEPLVEALDYDIEELVVHLSTMFDNLFTNLLIRRLREALGKDPYE